jgi:type IV pilus assembly protein PilM
MQVLVGGANKDEVGWYRDALTVAKIRPEVMELAAVSVVNAFQLSHAELCENEIVLVVDIGGRSTTINFLRQGVPVITRIMHFGGYQLSEYIGQMLTLETTAAEQEKVRMSEPVQALVRTAISPLARELRSSIDFFERQHERHVGRAFACGGSACSAALLDLLSEVVGIRIEQWNPVETFETGHFNGEGAKLAALAPTLAAAIGAAAARL